MPNRAILVVDDDAQVRWVFGVMLEAAGYNVTRAESGRVALQILRSRRFDVLVLDLEMPGLDGFDVLRVTRSEFPELRVLVVSGYLDGGLLKAAEHLGADIAFNKSHASHWLVMGVRYLARQSSARKAEGNKSGGP